MTVKSGGRIPRPGAGLLLEDRVGCVRVGKRDFCTTGGACVDVTSLLVHFAGEVIAVLSVAVGVVPAILTGANEGEEDITDAGEVACIVDNARGEAKIVAGEACEVEQGFVSSSLHCTILSILYYLNINIYL